MHRSGTSYLFVLLFAASDSLRAGRHPGRRARRRTRRHAATRASSWDSVRLPMPPRPRAERSCTLPIAPSVTAKKRAAPKAPTWSAPSSCCTTRRAKRIGPAILKGFPDKGMPPFPNFAEGQLYDIAQFLHLQVELVANRGLYKRLNVVTGDAKAGEAYFNGAGGCKGCHSVTGDLAHVGTKYQPEAVADPLRVARRRRLRRRQGSAAEGHRHAAFGTVRIRHRETDGRLQPVDVRRRGQLPLLAARGSQGRTRRSPGRATASCSKSTPTRTCTISLPIW